MTLLARQAQLRMEQEFGPTCLLDRELCVNATDATDPGAWQPLAVDTRLDVPSVWAEVSGLPEIRDLVAKNAIMRMIMGKRSLAELRVKEAGNLLVLAMERTNTKSTKLPGQQVVAAWNVHMFITNKIGKPARPPRRQPP